MGIYNSMKIKIGISILDKGKPEDRSITRSK